MSLLRNRLYLSVVIGHFTIDIFNNMGPVIVTFLSTSMALTAAQIGLAVGLYQLVGAISQPPFGWLTDKIGSRWLGPISISWTVSMITLAVFMAQKTNNFTIFLIPFGLAAIGSGAFHPQGVMHASSINVKQAATGTAVFFLFGQGGLATGPVLAGITLQYMGTSGIYLLAFSAIPFILFIFYGMGYNVVVVDTVSTAHTHVKKQQVKINKNVHWWAIAVLAALMGGRSWVFFGTVTFLPKLFQDMGWSSTEYGSVTGMFWIGSAIAGVVAGNMADRWGRRHIMFITILLSSIPTYFLPVNNGWVAFPLALLSGILLGASHSIMVVIAQDLLPLRKALASGITLGYLFGVGATSAWAIGTMVDQWGLSLGWIIQAGAVFSLLVAMLALILPTTGTVIQSQTKGALV